MLTADLDKTVVMDWSKETLTSGDQDIGSESGAGDIEFDSDDLTEEPAAEESAVEVPAVDEVDATADAAVSLAESDEPEEHLSSVEFDLEDLNVDLDAPVDSDDMDDFSSTIQTNIEEIRGGDNPDSSAKSDSVDLDVGDDAFGLEPLDSDDDDSISAEGIDGGLDALKGEESSIEELLENSNDKDFDATMELDSLLSELNLDEDDEKKKDS